jgi:hypothetical protein
MLDVFYVQVTRVEGDGRPTLVIRLRAVVNHPVIHGTSHQ